MEQGKAQNEVFSANPFWKMHRDLQDVKLGLKAFNELRKDWVAWADQEIQEQSHLLEERGTHSHRIPPASE